MVDFLLPISLLAVVTASLTPSTVFGFLGKLSEVFLIISHVQKAENVSFFYETPDFSEDFQ